jgi:hypothetical protein
MTMSLSAAPTRAAAAESSGDYSKYFSQRQFARQGRVVLFALASELYENFTAEEARGFFRQIGVRIAQDITIPSVVTIDDLEAQFNKAMAELDWGYATMTVEDHVVAMRQYAFPGHLVDEPGALAWRRAFAAILEGVYTTWLRLQGGGPSLEVKVKNDTASDVLELAYGV